MPSKNNIESSICVLAARLDAIEAHQREILDAINHLSPQPAMLPWAVIARLLGRRSARAVARDVRHQCAEWGIETQRGGLSADSWRRFKHQMVERERRVEQIVRADALRA